jgi:hypothetical protein
MGSFYRSGKISIVTEITVIKKRVASGLSASEQYPWALEKLR